MGKNARLDRNGISYMNRMISTSIAPACFFFVAAWRIDIPRAWVYFALFTAIQLSNLAFLAACRTELCNARGRTPIDVDKSDRLIMPLYLLFSYAVAPVAAGIELGRLRSGFPGTASVAAGMALLAASGILENWAMYVNDFYERSIRLQRERDQRVVARGPYAFVRHPGYVSYILRVLSLPLALGSSYSILPTAVGVVLLIVRTRVEDALLMANLPGYKEYSEKVKYRLLPPVW